MSNLNETNKELLESAFDEVLEHGVVTLIEKKHDIENHYSSTDPTPAGATFHPKTALHVSSPSAEIEVTVTEPSKMVSYKDKQDSGKTTSFVAANDIDSEQCPVCGNEFDDNVWEEVGYSGDLSTASISYKCPDCDPGKIHVIY